jgi:hypothetical protein
LEASVDREAIERQINDIADRHEAPKGDQVPADLHDRDGHMLTTKDGFAVAGRILVEDVAEGSKSPANRVVLAVGAPLLMVCVLGQMATGWLWPWFILMALWAFALERPAGIVGGLLWAYQCLTTTIFLNGWTAILAGFGYAFVLAVWPAVLAWYDINQRRKKLAEQVKEQPILPENKPLFEARKRQAENAARDKSPFIQLGKAVGHLHERNADPLAPDKNMAMGLTASDLSTHLAIIGGTGSGKTSGCFRPMLQEWTEASAGGLLVMDGKGQLPAELTSLPDYELVTPDTSTLALIEGLTPEDVADVIVTLSGADDEGKKEPIWDQQAEKLLRNSGLLLEAANKRAPERFPWTLAGIAKTANDLDYRKEMGAVIAEQRESNPIEDLERDAGLYFKLEFDKQPENFRGSVVGTMNAWLAPILGHRDLRPWCHAEKGVDLAKVFNGARIGLCVPRYRYGSAGSAITEMCKIRIYRAAQRRGDKWKNMEGQTSCLLAIDEAQEVLGDADLDMAPVARSLGVYLAMGFQAVEQIHEKFGNSGGDALLAQFLSVVAFKSSPRTQAWLSARMGETKKIKAAVKAQAYSFQHAILQRGTDPVYDTGNLDFDGRRPTLLVHEQVQHVKSAVSSLLGGHGEIYRVQGESEPLVDAASIGDHLSVPFRTFAMLNRAGVQRRDFMDVEPIFGD